MRVLVIETLGAPSWLGLFDGDQEIAMWRTPGSGSNARASDGFADILQTALQALGADAAARRTALDRLVVATGPGAFAGVRVGVAAARALALALRTPAVGVTAGEALSAALLEEPRAEPLGLAFGSAARPLWAVIERRGQMPHYRSEPILWRAAPRWAGPMAAAAQDADIGPARAPLRTYAALGRSADAISPPAPFYGRGPDAAPSENRPPRRLDE